jgi:type I restriction enzyme S subunit
MAHVYVFCVSPIGIRSDNRADKQSEIQLRIGETDCGECGENLGGVGVMDFWETWTFGDLLAEPVRNGIYKKKEFHGRGQKIINMGDLFSYDLISSQEMKRIELNNRELANNLVKDGDLLFARRSFVLEGAGKCSLVVQPSEDTTFESSVIRVRLNPDSANPRFYYYLFRSPQGRALISSIVTGAVVSGIRGSELVLLKVPKPPLPTQHKIAAILSPYDDLIENNTRRIKILEEMAQIIYRQWFIEFQFPGHEQVPMVESELGVIPQEWEVKELGEVVSEIIDYRGKTPKKLGGDWSESGIMALSAMNVKQGRLVNLEKAKFVSEELYKKWMKSEVEKNDILMTSEAPLGEAYCLAEKKKICLSQRLFCIRANPNIIKPSVLFYAIRSPAIQNQLHARATGTTVAGIRQSALRKISVLIPPLQLQSKAESVLGTLISTRETLDKKNINLRQTRDLLLPRLISGELDVSELDIDID